VSDCNHSRVYASSILTSDPPQRKWVCSKCGEKGTQTFGAPREELTYEQVLENFKHTVHNGTSK